MPALISQISSTSVSVFHTAASLPQKVWSVFKTDPRNSNIIYSHALKTAQDVDLSLNQIYIVCTTDDTIDFVLSCTHHAMGTYPIFIYSAHPANQLTFEFVLPRIRLLADYLRECVEIERVYSIFAVDMVSSAFAETWSRMTKIGIYADPYYAAKITFCTSRSLKVRQFTMIPGLSYELRLATTIDIPAAANLCYGFAAEAEPFVLSMEQAIKEATLLVSLKQLWVHTIREGERPTEIASIVAVTRESASVAAITKVFTNPDWRSRRCAERLVRKVTQILLRRKESVILYVAHNNPAASKVYDRVGFAGLTTTSPPVNGVDSWLELGFDRDMVALGHW